MNKMLGYLMLGYLMLGAMPALAQLGLGMVGMTVDQAVAEIRKNYETALSATEASASRSMFDARTHALVVLGQLDLIASKRGAELFRNLREAEKQIFLRADELLRKIGTNAENLTADMQSLANTAENMVGGILGSVPRLRSISPSFAIADGREVRFKAGGNFLDYGPASLELAGVPCMPERLITTESIFRCKMPGSAPTLGHFLPGTLTVYLERTWWQALTFREGDQRKIPVGLTALGSTIGTLTVLADGQRDTETRNSRSQTIGHRNDHCSGDTHLSPSFNPASPSCRIVASSIKVHERSRSSNSVNGGLRSVSETGFQWSGIARNNGSCGPRVSVNALVWTDAVGLRWTSPGMRSVPPPSRSATKMSAPAISAGTRVSKCPCRREPSTFAGRRRVNSAATSDRAISPENTSLPSSAPASPRCSFAPAMFPRC